MILERFTENGDNIKSVLNTIKCLQKKYAVRKNMDTLLPFTEVFIISKIINCRWSMKLIRLNNLAVEFVEDIN